MDVVWVLFAAVLSHGGSGKHTQKKCWVVLTQIWVKYENVLNPVVGFVIILHTFVFNNPAFFLSVECNFDQSFDFVKNQKYIIN